MGAAWSGLVDEETTRCGGCVGRRPSRHGSRRWLAAAIVSVWLVGGCAPDRPIPSTGDPTAYDPLVLEAVDARGFELPSALEPPWLLPSELVAGPHHVVVSIANDGFTNHYHVATTFGPIEASTTGLLRKRVHEIGVMAALEEADVTPSKVYLLSTANAARGHVEGAAQVLFHPVQTAIDVPSGMWIYARRLAAMAERNRTFHEDDYGAELIGFSDAKRQWAYRLGVDVYSGNALFQQTLDRYAWYSLGGGLTVQIPLVAVSGPAGYALTATGTTNNLKRRLRDQPPEDIRRQVRTELTGMGVAEPVAERFASHPWYPPTRLLVVAESLALMDGVKNPQSFVEAAVEADEPDETYFFGRLALMLALYSEIEEPITELMAPGGLVMARTENGDVVVPLYLDWAIWSESMSRFVDVMEERVPADAARKRVVVSGWLSEISRQHLVALGWELIEGVEMTWLADIDQEAWKPGEPNPDRVLPEFGG